VLTRTLFEMVEFTLRSVLPELVPVHTPPRRASYHGHEDARRRGRTL